METTETTAEMGRTAYTTPSDREVRATRIFDAPRKLDASG